MWTFLNNLLFGNRITGIYQWRDESRTSHLYIFTGKKVIEVDYERPGNEKVVTTSKQIKKLKEEIA